MATGACPNGSGRKLSTPKRGTKRLNDKLKTKS